MLSKLGYGDVMILTRMSVQSLNWRSDATNLRAKKHILVQHNSRLIENNNR